MKSSITTSTLLFLGMVSLILYSTQASGFHHPFSNMVDKFRLLCIVISVLILLKIMHQLIAFKTSAVKKNMYVTIVALLMVFSLLEGVFMFMPRSYGKGEPENLSERLWFAKYWRTNSLGYRDDEIDASAIEGKKKIIILGDSFVAGHGIEDPKNRFSNLLESKLGDAYKVFNLGINGADTQAEFNKLMNFPVKPDVLILAHYVNDIERVPQDIASLKIIEPTRSVYQAGFINDNYLVKNSYLLNYLSYKFSGTKKIFSGEERSITDKEELLKPRNKDNYQSFYLRENMFREHQKNLYQFVLLSRREGIPLVVLLLPETWDETIDFTEEYVNVPLSKFFRGYQIPVMDAYQLFKDTPIESRVVNANDAHPSPLIHQKIADALFKTLTTNRLI